MTLLSRVAFATWLAQAPPPMEAPWAAPATPAASPPTHDAFEVDRLAADVAYLAIRPRDGEAARAQARAWLGERLAALGFAVSTPEVPGYGGRNVIAVALGDAEPHTSVVVGAHFDTVPGSPGADDNASGVAAVLAVAAAQAAAGPAPRTLVIALWDLEERGLLGSEAWVEGAVAGGRRIAHALVLECVGFRDARPLTQDMPWSLAIAYPSAAWRLFTDGRRGDFLALVGDATAPLAAMAAAAGDQGLPTYAFEVRRWLMPLARLSDLWRSDHASFWAQKVPATLLTDTANLRNPHYHRGSDLAGTLDLDFLAAVARAADAFVGSLRLRPAAPAAAGR